MDVNFLLEIAIKETINLKANEVFLLRELFKGYEWNRIERKDRLLLWTLFVNYVKNENSNIKILEKTSSGQQKYIITNKMSN